MKIIIPAAEGCSHAVCSFAGDPEAQAVLPRLESDLLDLLEAVVDGRLADAQVTWSPKPAVCVVMASQGYPGSYESGKVIEGLERAAAMDDVYIYHAGTTKLEHLTLSGGEPTLHPDLMNIIKKFTKNGMA